MKKLLLITLALLPAALCAGDRLRQAEQAEYLARKEMEKQQREIQRLMQEQERERQRQREEWRKTQNAMKK